MLLDNFCEVKKDGSIGHVGSLPKNWGSIAGFNRITDLVKLASLGWLPMEEVHPAYDRITHHTVGYDIDIQEDKVVYTDNIIAYTAEELAQNIINDAISEIIRLENGQNQSARLLREAALGIAIDKPGHPEHGLSGNQRLQDIEAAIAVQRAKLT